jgi:hypothetical protein
MKKFFKIVLCALLAIILSISCLVIIKSRQPLLKEGYAAKVETGGPLEQKYIVDGPEAVAYKEYPLLQPFKKYIVHYPVSLETSSRRYPVIVVCNGSGTPATKYKALQKHYASWGFIVIGTEDKYSWYGFSGEMCVRHLEFLDSTAVLENGEKNFFMGKIDFENVGITGHSQGGVGVFNTISVREHKDIFKAAVALSPTQHTLAENLQWHYDVSGIKTPTLLLCGTTEGPFSTPESLKENFDGFPAPTPLVMATRDGVVHNDMLHVSDGYVTAWFLWLLKGDQEAGMAFTDQAPEFLSNKQYQNQIIRLK